MKAPPKEAASKREAAVLSSETTFLCMNRQRDALKALVENVDVKIMKETQNA